MTATFGDFLDAADTHIGDACRDSVLPSGTASAVVGQLHHVVAALTSYLADVATGSGNDLAAADGTGGCAAAAGRARLALRQAGAALWSAADTALIPSPRGARSAAADLSAAAMSLIAGRDLLQTHFRPGPAGGGLAASHWAPVITAAPVTAAMLGELSGYSHQLARWAAQLWLSGPPGTPETHAFNTASRGLWDAAAALHDAQRHHPPPPAGRIALRAIPANAPPPRQTPNGGEPIHQLCAGATTTAERLRHLALPQPGTAWPQTPTAASWQRTAQAAAIIGHVGELILRSLARAAGTGQAVTATLRSAADWLAKAWLTGRTAARHWDPITTGTRGPLTAASAETADLVLWMGRLAYRNPAWTPARRHTSVLRDPAELAAGPDGSLHVLAAVHHAIDGATQLLAADRKAIAAAAAAQSLFIPTRLLPDSYDVPYRYAPTPRETMDSLLGSYNTAIHQASRAVGALDKLAIETDAPSAILAMARAAAQAEQVTSRAAPPQAPDTADRAPVVRLQDIVQRRLRDLGVSEPALLLRAAGIDEAANDLIAEAIAKSQRRDAAEGPVAETSDTRHAAHIAAQDSPASVLPPGPQTASWVASSEGPAALAATDLPARTAPPESRRASGATALSTARRSVPRTPHAEDRTVDAARASRRRT